MPASFSCGAPTRYWRFGIVQLGTPINGSVTISQLGAYDSLSPGATNLLTTATKTLDHTPGTFEVTEPMWDDDSDPATPDVPLLDGAVLVDGDPATVATVNIVNAMTGAPWYIHADLGAGNETSLAKVAINVPSHHRSSLSDFVLQVELSADNVSWVVVDMLTLKSGHEGVFDYFILTGRGDFGRQLPVRGVLGDGFIPGIVSEDSVVKPNNRVLCFDRDNMSLVRQGLSDQNGTYIFYGLDTTKKYLVMAVDDDGSPMKQPSVWDHVTPTSGLISGEMARQTYQNRVAITNWKCNGVYLPGLYPWQVNAVGMSDYFNYEGYSENPFASQYGLYNTDNIIQIGSTTPLRPDQPPVYINKVTSDRRQLLAIEQHGSEVASTGFAIEVICAPTVDQDHWVCIRGQNWNDNTQTNYSWRTFETSNDWPYRSGFIRSYIGHSRRVRETAYINIKASSIRIIFFVTGLGRQDYTVTLSNSLIDSNQHHIVLSVMPGDSAKLFIDGALVDNHSLAGGGELMNLKVWNTDTPSEGTIPAHLGCVSFVDDPNASTSNSWRFRTQSLEFSLFSSYTAALTDAEVADLYLEATGGYTDVTALPSVTGYEANVLNLAPIFYHPMQEAAVDEVVPAVTYPGPIRRTRAGDSTASQTTLLPRLNDSSMAIGQSTSGSSRSWFKFFSSLSTSYDHGYIAGPNFSSTREVTMGVWVNMATYPTSESHLFSTYSYQPHAGGYNSYPAAGFKYGIKVTNTGIVKVLYHLYTNANAPIEIDTGYTLPTNTNVFLMFRIDQGAAEVALFVNGTVQYTQSFGGHLIIGRASFVRHSNDGNTQFIRDAMIFNYALTDAQILDLYNQGI